MALTRNERRHRQRARSCDGMSAHCGLCGIRLVGAREASEHMRGHGVDLQSSGTTYPAREDMFIGGARLPGSGWTRSR